MKQKKVFEIFMIIICFILLMPSQSLAAIPTNEYTIQSYNIDMIVNEDNTFEITENITAYFNVSKHGIYRKIPLKNSIVRADGTTSNNRAKITDISVSENYTTYNENGYKVIKIGDANQALKGIHNYTIKYKYNIGKDPLKNADELYFNLIGDQWDTRISNVTFTITMPKAFDESLLGFASGYVGSTNSSNVSYSVEGNTITGSTIDTLNAGQALTVRITLPEGYFVGASSNINMFSIFVIFLCAIFILIAYGIWVKYGKDEQVIETVEFYPPAGYNSAEVGFLYKGYADTKDIISLLIYLADKGYLRIEETSDRYSKKPIKLSDEQKQNVNIKIQELENKIKQEKLKDINSPKIKIWKNSLEIYRNIDKPVEYELSENEERILKDSLKNSKKEFRIVKLKEYDGNNEYERIFFNGLFTPHINDNYATFSDLYNNFYIKLDRIKAKFNTKENKNKIFEPSAKAKKKILIIMAILIFLLITIKPILEYYQEETLIIFALLFPRNRFYSNNRKLYGHKKNS